MNRYEVNYYDVAMSEWQGPFGFEAKFSAQVFAKVTANRVGTGQVELWELQDDNIYRVIWSAT